MSNKNLLVSIVETKINQFADNRMCKKIDQGELEIEDYHQILCMIFHQVRESSSTFALSGVNCPPRLQTAKDYLFHHAEEEKSHWRWVINDLKQTGYGADIEGSHPLPACQNYVAFNYYTALKMPIARLAIAAVLEGIGAKYGAHYAREVCRLLHLKPEQAQFYFGHGDTDVGHIQDIWDVIDACDLTDEEWSWMNHAATTAGDLYKIMYDEAGRKC